MPGEPARRGAERKDTREKGPSYKFLGRAFQSNGWLVFELFAPRGKGLKEGSRNNGIGWRGDKLCELIVEDSGVEGALTVR